MALLAAEGPEDPRQFGIHIAGPFEAAERIILELKDKVGVADTWQEVASGQMAPATADAELALMALGYKQIDARKAIRKVIDTQPDASVEELVRGALRSMQ